MYNKEALENTISGLFITFQSIGESIGPMLNSILVQYYGYRHAQEYYALYLISFCLLYFFFCGNILMFGNPCYEAQPLSEDEEMSDLIGKDRIQVYDKKSKKSKGANFKGYGQMTD